MKYALSAVSQKAKKMHFPLEKCIFLESPGTIKNA
jgi:hypothetical protein